MNLSDEVNEKDNGMTAYSYFDNMEIDRKEKTIKPIKVSYGDASFKNFDFREVFIEDKPKGEYYVRIKSNDDKVINNASIFLANRLNECEVGVIDPGCELNLEFHIYIKTQNEMIKEIIIKIMEDIDEYITALRKE